ncbi:MAG: hypothetical protein V1775_03585 [Bacteroidota bacterium]
MKRLEDFINENRPQFETHAPGRNHEEKFLKLLDDQERLRSAERYAGISKWLKIAAAVLVLAGFSFGILAILDNPAVHTKQTGNKLPSEIVEMEHYFAVQTREKLDHIETLAGSAPEAAKVKTMLMKEIETLNESSETLKSEYIEGNRDERLVDAIKNNYRILGSLLDKVLDQLDKPTGESSETMNPNSNSNRYETIIS